MGHTIFLTTSDICTEQDNYISSAFEQRQAIWYAVLSNGKTVYQDDDRPNTKPPSAWLRLQNYCWANRLKIVEMGIVFRSNRVSIDSNASGYFFTKVVACTMGEECQHQYAIGTVRGSKVYIDYYSVPELVKIRSCERPLNECIENVI